MVDQLSALGAVGAELGLNFEPLAAAIKAIEDQPMTMAQAAQSTCGGVKAPSSTFGMFPNSTSFGDHHSHAQSVVESEINGVLQDLKNFQETLAACVRAHQQNDDNQAEALNRMAARLGIDPKKDGSSQGQHASGNTANHGQFGN